MAETKERLLGAARELFLERGYAGTGVESICQRAEVSKGSFYHFFESKEDLALAVLRWSLERSDEILSSGGHTAVSDPVERALAYLRHVEESSDVLWKGGCILATFTTEVTKTNPRLQAAVLEIFGLLTEDLANRLAPLASEGRDGPSPTDLAEQFFISAEGSILLAKAYDEPERVRQGLRHFRKNIEARLAQVTS